MSLEEYDLEGTVKPKLPEHMSYNIPSERDDCRAFAFPNANGLLDTLTLQMEIAGRIHDVGRIWDVIAGRASDDSRFHELAKMLVRAWDVEKCVELIATLAREYGIDAMVDAYYDGIPLEDIIA